MLRIVTSTIRVFGSYPFSPLALARERCIHISLTKNKLSSIDPLAISSLFLTSRCTSLDPVSISFSPISRKFYSSQQLERLKLFHNGCKIGLWLHRRRRKMIYDHIGLVPNAPPSFHFNRVFPYLDLVMAYIPLRRLFFPSFGKYGSKYESQNRVPALPHRMPVRTQRRHGVLKLA